MKKLILTVGALGIGALILGGLYFYQVGLTVQVTEKALQERLAEGFPIARQQMKGWDIELSSPRVRLAEGGERVFYDMRVFAAASSLGKRVQTAAKGSAAVRYNPEEGSFFLADLRIETLDAEEIPTGQRERVREGVGRALQDSFREHLIYRLRHDDLRLTSAMLTLRDIQTVDGRLRLHLGLRRAPDPAVLPE